MEIACGVGEGVVRIVDLHQVASGVEGFRKVAGQLLDGRQARLFARRAFLLGVFVSTEEKGFILADGSADDAAVLVAMKSGNSAAGAIGEPVVGVKGGIAHEVVAGPMELVRAGAGDHVDDDSTGLTVFGREEVRLHLELLDNVDRGKELQVGHSEILFNGCNRGPVDEDVGGAVAGAVGAEVGVVVAPATARADHTGGEISEAHRVPSQVRELQDVLVIDHLPEIGDGGINECGGAGDFDGGSDIADLQLSVKGALFLHSYAEGAAGISLEAGCFDCKGVIPRG